MKSTPSGMNEVVWADRPHEVLTNGHPEMSGVQSARHVATRSQDDAMVGYFFQRPQTDPDFQNYSKQSRWALGDDSVLEVRGSDAAELESDFQALALETGHPLEYSPAAKKLWEDSKPDDNKTILFGDQWRDAPWSTGHNSASEHAISQPIMVQRRSGSYPGSDAASMLSPRSSDTGGLGVKMVEYVLGSSPTSKDLDSRMSRLHLGMNSSDASEKLKKLKSLSFDGEMKGKEQENSGVIHQTNGIMQNGLTDDTSYHHSGNSRQSSPSEDISKKHLMNDKLPKHSEQMMPPSSGTNLPPGGPSLGGLDPNFEGVGGIDSLPFDYTSAFMQSIDSPNTIDYNSQVYSRGQGQPLHMMSQQQYPMQQQGQMQAANPTASPAPFASSPYVMNQDPYAAATPMGTLMPGPAMVPQYYGMPPWGMFPTPGMVQSGQGQTPNSQQQLMRSGGARPMTPQGPGGEAMPQGGGGMPQSMQGPGGQYQVVAPPYYDQNGSVMISNRQMGTTMRIVPPVLVNPTATGPTTNPGTMGNGGLRLLSSQGQQNPAASLFNSGTPNSNTMYTSPANSTMNFSHPNSGLGFSGTNGNQLGYGSGLGLGPAQPQNTLGYGSSSMGPIGASLSAIGTSIGGTAGSPRRDSFDRRDVSSLGTIANTPFSAGLENQLTRQMPQQKASQFYGPLGSVTASGPGPIGMLPPNQSLTPPPSINGSLGNLNLGALGGRMLSAAPGAEAKYMIRNGPLGSNVLGSSSTLFPNRTLQRSSSLEKPTGRSRLLEDFRNNRYPNLQLRDLSNHIVEFSQDQHGSRFIQQKLERATPSEKQLVFTEILGAAYSLMTDVFGNYVIQKFFEFGTNEQKQALALKVKGHVLPLALQMYGCRVIQKALESIPPEQQKEIVKELDGHVLKCVKDQNGNHVVQKCIECVDPLALQFIINAFQGQVFSLSTHPYGCRVIQRILEHCTTEQTTPVLEELHQHTEQLVQDQYGNYVVQHVLEHGCQDDKSKIVSVVRGKVLSLSQHKFASNVVEKCVTHASRAERAMLIEEVCTYNDGPHSALYAMMKDQYANYVVQRMIEVAEPPQRKLLLHKIRPHVTSLRKYTYGKHILAKLEKYLLKNSDLGPIGAPPNGAI